MSLDQNEPDDNDGKRRPHTSRSEVRWSQDEKPANSKKGKRTGLVLLALIGSFLFGTSQNFVGGLAVHKITSEPAQIIEEIQKTFADIAADYRRSYFREPVARLVTIPPDDEKGMGWLARWAGFHLPDIAIDELGDELGYEFKGFAHYAWDGRRIVVGVYDPTDENAKGGPIFLCLTRLGAEGLDLGSPFGFLDDRTNFVTSETTSRHDGERIALAAVGAASLASLQDLAEHVVADF